MTLHAGDVVSDRVANADFESRVGDVLERSGKRQPTHVAAFDGGRFAGLIRLQDLLLSSPLRIFADLIPEGTTTSVHPDMPAQEVGRLMQQSGVGALPVVRGDGAFVGAVTEQSLLDGLLAEQHRLLKEGDRLQQVLEAERIKSNVIVDTAADGIITIDQQGIVESFNKAAENIFGYTADEVTGQTVNVLIPSPDSERHDEYIARYLRTGEVKIVGFGREVEGRRKDGTIFPMHLAISEVSLVDSRLFTGIIHDLSVRKRAEEQLRRAKENADSANQAKSEFLTNMSHEIRTPMTAILGFAEKLLDPELAESDRLNAAHTVRRNGQHLLNIINDILDLSKIEAGKMEVEQIRFSPCQIVAEVASLMRGRALAGGLSLDVEYAGLMPETIRSDPSRMRQILINLLGNAIKFTKQGGVRLRVELLSIADSPATEVPNARENLQSEIRNPP